MRQINSTLRNITMIIALVILTIAVYWLVSRRAEPELPSAVQVTEETTPTITPQTTPEVKEESTRPPYTPEYSMATVVFITPPPETTPIPTPTFEPLTGQAIGGYIFSEARPISNTIGHSLTFFDWLPDKPDKLLILTNRNGISLEVIDVNTGEIQMYYNGKTLVRFPTWLPARQSVAYLIIDEQDYTKQYVWVNDSKKSEQVFTTSWLSPLLVTPDGSGIILFNANWQLTQVGGLNTQEVKLATDTQIYIPSGYKHDELYQTAQSPDRRKAIYFNKDWLLLTDFTTGKITPIDLESLKTEGIPRTTDIQNVVWSPDNSKLALLVAAGNIGDGNNLFILDLLSKNLNFIKDDFHYVAGLDWDPDSKYLIISGVIGDREGYNVNALFMVDTISDDMKPVSAVPSDAIGAIPNWSPDGSQIAVLYADKPGNPGLYVIDVQLP